MEAPRTSWRAWFLVVALARLWDRLWTVLWVGFLGFLLSLTVVLAPPVIAATAYAAVRLVREESFGPRDFFEAGWRFLFRAWVLFAGAALISSGLAFNLRFYAAGDGGLPAMIALSVTAVLAGVVAVVVPFLFPAMVRDDLGVWGTVRRSLRAVSKGPLNALAAALAIAALGAMLYVSTLGLALILPVSMLFAASALEAAVGEPDPGPTRDTDGDPDLR